MRDSTSTFRQVHLLIRYAALIYLLGSCRLKMSNGLQIRTNMRVPHIMAEPAVSRRAALAGTAMQSLVTGLVFRADPAYAEAYQAFIGPSSVAPRIEPFQDGSWNPPPRIVTRLGTDRIAGLSPITPFQQPAFGPSELYYPTFLFGAWNVTSTLKQKIYPFGTEYVPSNSLVEGSPRNRMEKVGESTTFEAHYFSTLADTLSNKLTVNLGLGVPEPKIIADRAFNVKSISTAYKQLAPVEDVEWDYSNDPTRLSLRFASVAEDMRPLGQRRGEVYFNARGCEQAETDPSIYCAVERSRSLTVGPGTVIVSDQETITEFQRVDADTVSAVSRTAVYLTPNPNSREGILWSQVGGKAVAYFDYQLDMKRIREEFVITDSDGSSKIVSRACVQTPKDVIQCE